MRAVVIGAGAMGGLFAARFGLGGSEVEVVDGDITTVDRINQNGLHVEGLTVADLQIHAATELPGSSDEYFVLVLVKSHHTAGVIKQHDALLRGARFVATLQNGWGSADILAEALGSERIVVGVTYESSRSDAPGALTHTGRGPTFVGPLRRGGGMGDATSFAELLTAAGFDATATDRVVDEVWKKLILNAATLAVSALTGLRAKQMPSVDAVIDLVNALTEETVAAARGLGCEIDVSERQQTIYQILANAGDGKGSMTQDFEARRPTEVDAINGAVVRTAAALGLTAPLSSAMCALVRGVEGSWRA